MSTKEIEAIENLANIPDEENDFGLEPFRSSIYNQPSTKKHKQRPRTVENERPRGRSLNCSFRKNKREQLKNQLKVLEENHQNYTPKVHQQVVTSQSVYFMHPTASRYNGFPAQPIKKQQPDKFVNFKGVTSKENFTPYYCLNPEQMIRNDIMKRFKLRESVRETEKTTKINNFLKMANTPSSRNKAAPILFLNEAKFKRTLTNLLS